MRKKLSPDAYEDFSGHSLEVGMKFYSHNDVDDLREELFSRVFDKKELPPEKKHELEKKIKGLEKWKLDQEEGSKDLQKNLLEQQKLIKKIIEGGQIK